MGCLPGNTVISLLTSIVGNLATSGSVHRPIVRSIIASEDRSYEQSWRWVTDRTINRGIMRSIVRSILESGDRSQINRGTLRPTVRPIVAPGDRSCDCVSRDHPLVVRSCSTGGMITPYIIATSYGFESRVRSCDWFCPGDHIRPLRFACDLSAIPPYFGRSW